MSIFIGPFRHLGSRRVDLEIEEELQFHLELLTEEHCRQDISWEQAQARALKRFGNVEQIKEECAQIARRNHPAVLCLKWFFAFIFVTGVLVRVFSTDYHVTRIGDLLMEVGVLGRLLLYLRGKSRPPFVKEVDDPAPLKLNDIGLSFAAYDQKGRTPVERVVSSK